jgi:spermidine/putrescine transport system substrate-binding protein
VEDTEEVHTALAAPTMVHPPPTDPEVPRALVESRGTDRMIRYARPGRLMGVVALVALVTMACGEAGPTPTDGAAETDGFEPTDGAPGARIVVSTWDGYLAEDLLDSFVAETGIEVELAFHSSNEDLIGRLDEAGGGGFDVVFVSAPSAERLDRRGWAARLDHDAIPNLSNLAPEASELAHDPGNRFSVPYTWGTTGLCYRSDLVEEEIDSWDDLIRPPAALQGKVTMLASNRWLLLPALRLLGHSINTTDEDELDEARQLLVEAKQHVLAFDDATFHRRLVSGEALLVQAWDGWCNYGIAEDPNISWVVPEEGSDLWVDAMVVLESSSDRAAAQAFINHVLRAEVGAWVIENLLYKVPNEAAFERVDAELLEQFPNLGMPPDDLIGNEVMRDVGGARSVYARIASEVTAP